MNVEIMDVIVCRPRYSQCTAVYKPFLKMIMHRAMNLLRQILHSPRMEINALFLWATAITGAAAGFLFWNLSAHFYTTQEVGLASTVNSLMWLLSGVTSLGIGMGIVRFLNTAEDRKGMINTALSFTCLTSLLVGTVYVAGINLWTPGLIALRQPWFFLIFLLLLVSTTHSIILQMVFLSLKRTSATFGVVVLLNILRLVFLFFFRAERAQGIVAAVAIATTLSNLFSFLILPRLISGFRPAAALSGPILRQLIPYSFAINMADFLNNTPTMLAPLLALENLGAAASAQVYIAWMMGSMMLSPSSAFAQSAFSEGASDPHRLRSILKKSGIYGLLITVTLATIGFLLSEWILRLFGPDYRGAATFLKWLCIAAPLSALDSLFTTAFRVQKRLWTMIIINTMILILFIGSQSILLKTMGINIMGIMWMFAQGAGVILSLVIFLRGNEAEKSEKIAVEQIGGIGIKN